MIDQLIELLQRLIGPQAFDHWFSNKGLRSIVDIGADLSKPIPDDYLQEKRGGGGTTLTYWQWQVGKRALDRYAPGWQWQVDSVVMADGHVAVTGRLYIPCLENPSPGVFRAGTGGDYEHQDETKRSKGFDPVLDAERQAFKRALSMHGFGFYLYPLK